MAADGRPHRSASSAAPGSTRCSTTSRSSRSTRRTARRAGPIHVGHVGARRVAFLPRHGAGHELPAPPHQLPRQRVGAARAGRAPHPGAVRVGIAAARREARRVRRVRPARRPHLRPASRPTSTGPAPTTSPSPTPTASSCAASPSTRVRGRGHRRARTRHGRGHPGPALLDPGRVDLVPRRGVAGHQHDPVPRGLPRPRAGPLLRRRSRSSPTTTPGSKASPASNRSPKPRSFEFFESNAHRVRGVLLRAIEAMPVEFTCACAEGPNGQEPPPPLSS